MFAPVKQVCDSFVIILIRLLPNHCFIHSSSPPFFLEIKGHDCCLRFEVLRLFAYLIQTD